MVEDQPSTNPEFFEGSLPLNVLKGFTKAQRRLYYSDKFPDAIGVGRTIPFTFILDHYLPDLIQRFGEQFKASVGTLVEDEDQLKQEAEKLRAQFDEFVDSMSSKDPLLAAIVNSTKGVHFINVIAMLEQTPGNLPGIPQEYSLDSNFWQNLRKIVEGAQID